MKMTLYILRYDRRDTGLFGSYCSLFLHDVDPIDKVLIRAVTVALTNTAEYSICMYKELFASRCLMNPDFLGVLSTSCSSALGEGRSAKKKLKVLQVERCERVI